jgi:Uma2 family endonuclease
MATMTAELETTDELEVAATHEPATLAEFLEGLGDVDPSRILWTPRPGTATEADLIARGEKLVELIDGTLVRKTIGGRESFAASTLYEWLVLWKRKSDAGLLGLPDAIYRLAPGVIRLPDLSFTSWLGLPNDGAHLHPVLDFAPELAVEVLSESDRPGAVKRKVREYFTHGTKLVWVVDARAGTVVVYTSSVEATTLIRTDTLDGGDILPGFSLPLAELFDNPQLNPRPQRGA